MNKKEKKDFEEMYRINSGLAAQINELRDCFNVFLHEFTNLSLKHDKLNKVYAKSVESINKRMDVIMDKKEPPEDFTNEMNFCNDCENDAESIFRTGLNQVACAYCSWEGHIDDTVMINKKISCPECKSVREEGKHD